MKGYIYKISNEKDGRFYIGSTINITKRKKRHFSDLEKGKHHCMFLQRAYEKYGKNSFEFTFREVNIKDENHLRLLEERYINYCWDSGKLYNASKKGSGGDLISYHPKNKKIREMQSKLAKERYANLSDEEKKEYSEKMRGCNNPNYGNHWTNEMREKMSKFWKEYYSSHENYIKNKTFEEAFGEKKAKEIKKKISELASKRVGNKNPFFGKHHSEETRKKLSKLKFGKKNLTVSKKVLVNGVVYQSVDECAAKLNINYNTVAYRCRKNIYGFSYVGENDSLPQNKAKKMWTFEECEKLASECKTIKELKEKYPNVLYYFRNHKNEFEKIKNKYFTYIRTYWTLDEVIELAKKYNSYKEFRKNESTAYSSAVRHGWVDKVKEIFTNGHKKIR